MSIHLKLNYTSRSAKIHWYMWSHNAGKADYAVESTGIVYYKQTTIMLRIHVLVLSLHIIWHDSLFVYQM